MHSKSKPLAGRDFLPEHADRTKRCLPKSEQQVRMSITFTIAFHCHKHAFVFPHSTLSMPTAHALELDFYRIPAAESLLGVETSDSRSRRDVSTHRERRHV
jgi:hypothetical protein